MNTYNSLNIGVEYLLANQDSLQIKALRKIREATKPRQVKRDIARDHCNLFLLTGLICIKDMR